MNANKQEKGIRVFGIFCLFLSAACGNASGKTISESDTGSDGAGGSPPLEAAMPNLSIAAVKTLRFGWTDVKEASHYKLLENADGSSGFTQVGWEIPAGQQRVDLIVPLFARLNAQYILQSCNNFGCANSPIVTPAGSFVEGIGYVKASNTGETDLFGLAVALSADGSTLAVGAPGEDARSGGGGANDLKPDSGAVYVYTRGSDGVWSDAVFLKASLAGLLVDSGDNFGRSLAISADGSTLAVGADREDSNATGVGGHWTRQADNTAKDSGAVYVFQRNLDGRWGKGPTYIKASNTEAHDHFGFSLALSDDGRTLAVGALEEDSSAKEVDGNQADNSASGSGAVYVFVLEPVHDGSFWGQQAYIKASNTDKFDRFGISIALSINGDTLAVGAHMEDSAGTDGSSNGKRDSGAVYVYARDTEDNWSDASYIKSSIVFAHADIADHFGRSIALSDDGVTLAISAPGEDSSAIGINGSQDDNSAFNSGAVYIFRQDGESVWNYPPAYLKGSNTGQSDGFGLDISMSADGRALAVAANGEDSSAVGLNGDEMNNGAVRSGAAYVFTDDGSGWQQRAYVKSSNSEALDFFGTSAALSADGMSLAIGAEGEDSNSTQIGGIQSDNSAPTSGAVYVY